MDQFTDFLNDPQDYATSNNELSNSSAQIDYITIGFESCLTEKDYCREKEMDMECDWTQTSSVGFSSGRGREEDNDYLSTQDFEFLDSVVPSNYYYSPFEIAEEIEEPLEPENYGDEPSMLSAIMKRMKYERKISASLYAFNGIPECLKLKLESVNRNGRGISNQITNLKMACSKNKIEANTKDEEYTGAMDGKEEEKPQTSIGIDCSSSSSLSSSVDGELLLWNSLDLPNICFVK